MKIGEQEIRQELTDTFNKILDIIQKRKPFNPIRYNLYAQLRHILAMFVDVLDNKGEI